MMGRGRVGRLVRALGERREALLLALAALALAATFLGPGVQALRPQLELVVVLDITQSMNVVDASVAGKPVSRLAAAKLALEHLLDALPCGSKIGWGLFTEHRSFLLLSPIEVCEHHRELRDELRRIDGRMAWSGNSEVAKGLNSGMQIAKALDAQPALVFVTDGHEAPPINPRYRPNFSLARGDVRGLIVGVGGETPLPIPKVDPLGRPLGEWGADEVLQIDPRSQGRGGSVSGEQMADDDERIVAPLPGASPGNEHLSSLREGYLELLASETGLIYVRLAGEASLANILAESALESSLARPAPTRVDLRALLAAAAALLLLWPLLAAWRGARTGRRARTTRDASHHAR